MTNRRYLFRLLLALSLAVLINGPFAAPMAARAAAKTQAGTAAASDLTASLARIEKAIDDKRKELGIPGVSLVIVKDDKVIYLKGLGVKDFEKQVPVGADTLFAIGSATKAFTALAAVMSADEGNLSLEDSPKKFLPYFKMRDPETDAKITIRDLLSHRSGLNRTDLAWYTGTLNREEVIKVAGMAKPTAKLGEKFQYQNVMYAAAGEAVARAQHSTWDAVIAERIFKPLGMKASDTTIAGMQQSPDFSFGYEYNATTKETRRLPMRELQSIAPAGAINSSARDMARWLRFMLDGGAVDGKRLVSERGFHELISKQINVAGNIDYGLGWMLQQWDGRKVIEHDGSIDGFNSSVAMMPDQKLGFVLLSNVSASPLGAFVSEAVWSNLVGRKAASEADKTAAGPPADPGKEVGGYEYSGSLKELFGSYEQAQTKGVIEIALRDGKPSLVVPGQPAYPLEETEKDKLRSPSLPDTFWFSVTRDASGKVSGLVINQPEGQFAFSRLPEATPNVSVEELLAKVVVAYGGEGSIRKHKSSVTTVSIDFENQGITGEGVISAKAPNLGNTKVSLIALGKTIGTIVSYTDGVNGGVHLSFAPELTFTGKRLAEITREADFYGPVDWKTIFKTITFKRMAKVGNEDCYVLEMLAEKGNPVTTYISAKSFLMLRRDSVASSETSGPELPVSTTYSDHRLVDGVMIPFRTLNNDIANGNVIMLVKEVRFDVNIPDSVFRRPVK